MAAESGDVISAVTFGGKRVFSVSGKGVYTESANKVATGTLTMGTIGYGIVNRKVATSLEVTTAPLVGTYSSFLSSNEGTFAALGTESTAGDTKYNFNTGEKAGEEFNIRFDMTNLTTEGPCIKRVILKVVPAAPAVEKWTIPLILHEVLNVDGGYEDCNPRLERAVISALRAAGNPVTFQFGSESFSIVITDYKFYPFSKTSDLLDWNGTLVVEGKTL